MLLIRQRERPVSVRMSDCTHPKSKDLNVYEIIGKNLKLARQNFGYTQKEVAVVLGISPLSIFDYESCRTKITIDKLLKFCSYFDLSINEIVSSSSISVSGPIPVRQKRLVRDIRAIDALVQKSNKNHKEQSKITSELYSLMYTVTNRKIVRETPNLDPDDVHRNESPKICQCEERTLMCVDGDCVECKKPVMPDSPSMRYL